MTALPAVRLDSLGIAGATSAPTSIPATGRCAPSNATPTASGTGATPA